MVQCGKALPTKPGSLSLNPGIHKAKKRTDACQLSPVLHTYTVIHGYHHTYAHVRAHTHRHTNKKIKKKPSEQKCLGVVFTHIYKQFLPFLPTNTSFLLPLGAKVMR